GDLAGGWTWGAVAPRERARALRGARRVPTLLIGRTRRAHLSHHRPLHATEGVVNRLLTERLGASGHVDFLVPSFVVERDGAARLLARSRARDAAIYGEWAALLAGLRGPLRHLQCRRPRRGTPAPPPPRGPPGRPRRVAAPPGDAGRVGHPRRHRGGHHARLHPRAGPLSGARLHARTARVRRSAVGIVPPSLRLPTVEAGAGEAAGHVR